MPNTPIARDNGIDMRSAKHYVAFTRYTRCFYAVCRRQSRVVSVVYAQYVARTRYGVTRGTAIRRCRGGRQNGAVTAVMVSEAVARVERMRSEGARVACAQDVRWIAEAGRWRCRNAGDTPALLITAAARQRGKARSATFPQAGQER